MAALPYFVTDLPEPPLLNDMDPLADILHAMRLSGGVFLDAELTAPWCIHSHVDPEDCLPFMPMPRQVIAYHYVMEGTLLMQVAGESPVSASAGDILIMPNNHAHLLGSELQIPPLNASALIERGQEGGSGRIRAGGGGVPTRFFCGYLGCDDPSHPLLLSLPPAIKLSLSDAASASWVEGSISYAMQMLRDDGPGASISPARIAELLFAEAVRTYAKQLPDSEKSWLGGLSDKYVARALALIHTSLSDPWTLDQLAADVGLSRSAFADRFARHIGMSPMRYLSHRRLVRAADQLAFGQDPISEIAHSAGYASESAFTRAFKRAFDLGPATFRKTRQKATRSGT